MSNLPFTTSLRYTHCPLTARSVYFQRSQNHLPTFLLLLTSYLNDTSTESSKRETLKRNGPNWENFEYKSKFQTFVANTSLNFIRILRKIWNINFRTRRGKKCKYARVKSKLVDMISKYKIRCRRILDYVTLVYYRVGKLSYAYGNSMEQYRVYLVTTIFRLSEILESHYYTGILLVLYLIIIL